MLIPTMQDMKTARSLARKSGLGVFCTVFSIISIITAVLTAAALGDFSFSLFIILYALFLITIPTILAIFAIRLPERNKKVLEPIQNEISQQRKIIVEGVALKYNGDVSNIKKLNTCNWLFLTEVSIEYYPAKLFMSTENAAAIMLEDVTEVQGTGENYLYIKTKDGEKHQFFVWRAYTWEEKIKEALQTT